MLRRMSKESPPPIDELDEVTLRRPGPVNPIGPGPYAQRMGPYFSRPMGPEFMRRSCTFVAEAGWRKSSGGKDAKERQNLALKVRQKAAELGAEEDDLYGGGPKAAGRVQRLVGNVAGNLKSWSSSEDVRQSMMGAFNRTVSVITQARRNSKTNRNSIPELTAVTNTKTVTTVIGSHPHRLAKSVSASRFPVDTPVKHPQQYAKMTSRNSVPTLSPQTRINQDRVNNNNKSRLLNTQNKNINPCNNANTHSRMSSATHVSNSCNNNNINHADDHLFKKPAAPVGYRHYRSASQQQPPTYIQPLNNGGPNAGNVPRAINTPTGNPSGKRWFKHFQETAQSYDNRDGRNNRRSQPPTAQLPQQDHDQDQQQPQQPDGVDDGLDDADGADIGDASLLAAPSTPAASSNNNNTEPSSPDTIAQRTEHLRRKDLKIKQALEEKQHIIADILGIPREHFETLGDMAGESSGSAKEPRELVLAALYQANCLQEALNDALNIKESDIVAAKATAPSTDKPASSASLPLYPAPMNKLMNIAGSLSQQLNLLLNLVSERDDERDRMRRELVASRERLHQLHMSQSSSPAGGNLTSSATPTNSRPSSLLSQGSTVELGKDDTEGASSGLSQDEERTRSCSVQEELSQVLLRETSREEKRDAGADESSCTLQQPEDGAVDNTTDSSRGEDGDASSPSPNT